MQLYLQLLKESFKFSLKSLRDNKMRTFLSLLGVTVGIYSIIAVLAAVDSLDRNIKESLSGMGDNLIYLTKYSFGPTEVPRWKRNRFPQVTYQEYEILKRNIPNMGVSAYEIFGLGALVRYEDKKLPKTKIQAATNEIEKIQDFKIESGRFYNLRESEEGSPVAVLGKTVASQLFGERNPLGKEIRIFERKLTVIGVLKKVGKGFLGNPDDEILIPAMFMRKIVNTGKRGVAAGVSIKPPETVDVEAFEESLSQNLRKIRGLRPEEINNFFINKISSFKDEIDKIISLLNMVGWVIGGFSILVGGFGIANIMFVSVKERINLIGIQKALGAKRTFILFQFLFEAILLALFGGFLGVVGVWVTTFVASSFIEDFDFVLSFKNIFIGFAVSSVIGLVSGILPALSASRLEPVRAIRSGV